jgi:DNA (cytosine-5)-methyltransferase 1
VTQPLVLSLFPGIGLLDMAFEEEGFCVVRGPDLLWGRDIRDFHAPGGHFAGVIGGPPCQLFSQMRHMNPRVGQKHGNMIPEYERVVGEAAPDWFVMENVSDAPEPIVAGYRVRSLMLRDDWVGGATIEGVSRVGPGRGQRMTVGEMLTMQGAPATLLDDTAYTESAKRQMVGNGVPLPMGRAVARAVKAAMYGERTEAA